MIGQTELIHAINGHVERTDVNNFHDLFTVLDVNSDELMHALNALWNERSQDDIINQVGPKALYIAAAIDGFILGLRAARRESYA